MRITRIVMMIGISVGEPIAALFADDPTRVVHIPFSRSKEDEESGSRKGTDSVAESIGMEKDISCKAGLKRVMS